MNTHVSRRRFLAASATATAAISMPNLLLANKDSKQMVIGQGEHKFEVQHDWAKLPDKYTWQTTHNVAVDAEGLVYVIHEGRANLTSHPSIFVFDQKGKFIRAFGNQFQGGGHGIEVRTEGKEQFLYVCAYQNVKAFSKLTLKGETVWEKYAPMDSGVYKKDEDKVRVKRWGRDAFMPTNFAFLNDGGFLLADGYGSWYIHRYDKEGNWVSKFGGPGKGNGKFNLPHGIWIDRRPGRPERVVVCDRANHTLQYLTLEGQHLTTLRGFGFPANIDTYKNLMLVPELHARVTLLNEKNEVVAQLGDDVEGVVKKKSVNRGNAKTWVNGKFVHPHDACFDNTGNILVAEWVATGRITRLKRVS
ncbi:MAG: twin-arginine translocation signal domain-containing protein [Verrucomicrobiia bacterium]